MAASTLLAVTVVSALLFSLTLGLVGHLRFALSALSGVDARRLDGAWTWFHRLLLPLVLGAGVLADLAGPLPVLAVGGGLVCLAAMALSWSRALQSPLLTLLVLGVGLACLLVSTVVLIPRVLFGSGVPSAAMNVGFVFFALGALLAPPLAETLLRAGGPRLGLTLVACAALAVAALALTTPGLETQRGSDPLALLGDPLLWVAVAFFFFYAPLETSLSTWLRGLLGQMGKPEQRGEMLLAGFWAAFVAGRLLMAWLHSVRLLRPDFDPVVQVILCLIVAATLGNLTAGGRVQLLTLFLLALCLGPLLPGLLSLLLVAMRDQPGTAFGVFFGVGSLGSVLLSQGPDSDTSRPRWWWLPAVLGVLAALTGSAFALSQLR